MRAFVSIILLTAALLPLENLQAGLININFTHGTSSGSGSDGVGALGGDNWNRIKAPATASDDSFTLRKADSLETPVTLEIDFPLTIAGVTVSNGNLVQSEGWEGSTDGANLVLTLKGLLPLQAYRLALYSNRVGSGAPSDDYHLNGVKHSLPTSSAADIVLPGTEDVDYLLVTVAADSSGRLVISGPSIAGLQIQGRLVTSEALPAFDATISTDPAGTTGKGSGIRRVSAGREQTITQQGKGRLAYTFYPVVANQGTIVDRPIALLKYPDRDLAVVLRDSTTDENITAAAKAGRHRFDLLAAETRRFPMQLKPLKLRKTLLTASFSVKPSDGKAALGDCVAGAIRLKVKR